MAGIYDKSFLIRYLEGDVSRERDTISVTVVGEPELYIVKADDCLPDIAYYKYQDPLMWYVIGLANSIINPFELIPGQTLILPNLSR